jgi:hypothetical protein
VKARRDALRLPLDVPAAAAYGTPLNQLEQAVARADVPAAVSLENNGWPRPADAGIDNAEKDGFRCKPFGVSRQQIGRCLGVANRRISKEVDRGRARRHLVQHRLHLTGIRPLQAEIGKQHNHVVASLVVGLNLLPVSVPGTSEVCNSRPSPMAAISTTRCRRLPARSYKPNYKRE